MQTGDKRDTATRIRELEERITEKLNPDLERTVEERRLLRAQLQDYEDLERNLQLLQQQRAAAETAGKKPPPLRTRAPLGSDVEMEAVVKDTSKVIIKGLMGFWAECSQEEAPKYIAVQTKHLEQQIKKLDKQVAMIRTHIKLTLQALGELNQWPLQ